MDFEGRAVGTQVACGPNLQRVILPVSVDAHTEYYPFGGTSGHLPDRITADALSGSYSGPFGDEELGSEGYITMRRDLSRTR
jgi:hypothetical protein